MRASVGLALVAMLAGLQTSEAKGSYRYRAGKNYPSKGSNAWKYAGAGLIGAGVGVAAYYYVGGIRYRHHIRYDDDYNRYYGRQPTSWRQRYPRTTSRTCSVSGVDSSPEDTREWLVGEVLMDYNSSKTFNTIEFEVDLFMELVYRSSCYPPTEIVTMYRCDFPDSRKHVPITESEKSNTRFCQYIGDVASLPFAHGRSLLQTSNIGYTQVEFAVGVRNQGVSHSTHINAALKQALNDPSGAFRNEYNVVNTLSTAGSVGSSGSSGGSSGSYVLLQASSARSIPSLFSFVVFLAVLVL
eukprot:TRINITY_DN4635_c7_g1_i1.p1 TRINITY_DN4635_c7_g1~~TRINITY_DN4635_c7_g1_i1.p1  ORF type:complete len:298 (+),score=33.71 TRINITY_DN4635_c7_g1_i1:73-966(+)